MVSLNIMAIIIIVGFCRPAAAQWDLNVQGECMDPTTQSVDSSLFNGLKCYLLTRYATQSNTRRHTSSL